MMKKIGEYAGAMLLVVLVVVVFVAVAAIALPSPSRDERAAFDRWQAEQVNKGDANSLKGKE